MNTLLYILVGSIVSALVNLSLCVADLFTTDANPTDSPLAPGYNLCCCAITVAICSNKS